MKNRIIHPLWVHLPAIAVFVYVVIRLIIGAPFPESVPIHFNLQGLPDNYGSPWLSFGLFLGFSLLFIGLSIFLDELWARQEKNKTFNWLSLLDEVVVGAMAGITLGTIEFIVSGAELFTFPWVWFLSLTGSTVLLAIVLEWLRPFQADHAAGSIRDSAERGSAEPLSDEIERELAGRWQGKSTGIYWESQNPVYVTILTICLPLVLLAGAVAAWFSEPWASLVLLVVALLLVIPYGGLRTAVTRQDITVRFGLPGIRVLRLKMSEIASLELREFSPLREFGGYGIRFNGQMSAYYMRGSRGVLLTLHNGKKYLIGSDRPEQLLAVARVFSGKRV